MDMRKLEQLGVTSVGGQLDFRNVNIGFLTQDGPVLTPDGEAMLRELTEAPDPVLIDINPRPKRGRKARHVDEDGSDDDNQTTD